MSYDDYLMDFDDLFLYDDLTGSSDVESGEEVSYKEELSAASLESLKTEEERLKALIPTLILSFLPHHDPENDQRLAKYYDTSLSILRQIQSDDYHDKLSKFLFREINRLVEVNVEIARRDVDYTPDEINNLERISNKKVRKEIFDLFAEMYLQNGNISLMKWGNRFGITTETLQSDTFYETRPVLDADNDYFKVFTNTFYGCLEQPNSSKDHNYVRKLSDSLYMDIVVDDVPFNNRYLILSLRHFHLIVQIITEEYYIDWEFSIMKGFTGPLLEFFRGRPIRKDILLRTLLFLSNNGMPFTTKDLDRLYEAHGYHSVFRPLLLTPVQLSGFAMEYQHFPAFYYDVNWTLQQFIATRKKPLGDVQVVGLKEMFGMFASWGLKDWALTSNDEEVLQIARSATVMPTLKELARNASRKCVIRENTVTSMMELHRAVAKLFIPVTLKRVLVYELPIYWF